MYHIWLVFVKSNKFSPIPVISPVYDFVFVCGNNPHEWMPNKGKTLEIFECLILIQMMVESQIFCEILMEQVHIIVCIVSNILSK